MSKNFNIDLEKHGKVDKDLEQDKCILKNTEVNKAQEEKLKELELISNAHTETIRTVASDLLGRTYSQNKELENLKNSFRELKKAGIDKAQLNALKKVVQSLAEDLEKTVENDSKLMKDYNFKFLTLKQSIDKAIANLKKNPEISTKVINMINDNLKADIERFLNQNKVDSKQNERLTALENANFLRRSTDKNQDIKIVDNKEAICSINTKVNLLVIQHQSLASSLKKFKLYSTFLSLGIIGYLIFLTLR